MDVKIVVYEKDGKIFKSIFISGVGAKGVVEPIRKENQ